MKKTLILLLATVGTVLFSSCEKKLESEPKPFPIGTWRASSYYFGRIVGNVHPASALETIKENYEKEVSTDIPEAEAYLLTLNEDRTGLTSKFPLDETKPSIFDFKWQSSDGLFNVYGSMFISTDGNFDPLEDTYEIEESSADRMVLATTTWRSDAHGSVDGLTASWSYQYVHRYTFERVQ